MSSFIKCSGKWLALAVFILVAGFCYCCGQKEDEALLAQPDAAVLLQEDAVRLQEDVLMPQENEPVLQKDASVPWESQEEPSALQQTQTADAAGCYVHVCGEVEHPGVYELKEGQRAYEAIEMAGGFTQDAAESYLNLAEPVHDGMKLEVPDRQDTERLREQEPEGGPLSASLIDLNTATKEQLMTLRGIGEARAEDIIRYRQEHGRFERIEDIMKVSGIKTSAFEKIKDDITVIP